VDAHLSRGYISMTLHTWRKLWAFAQRSGHLPAGNAFPPPARQVPWPRLPRRKEPPAKPSGHPPIPALIEAISLLEQSERRLPREAGEVARLILLTGLRPGEALGLTPAEIHLPSRRDRPGYLALTATLDIGPGTMSDGLKTDNAHRPVDLSPAAERFLRARLKDRDPEARLWSISYTSLRKWWRQAQEDVGIEAPCPPHKLRYAQRTLCELSGFTERATTARLGHGTNISYSQMKYGTPARPTLEDLQQLDRQIARQATHHKRKARARRPARSASSQAAA
jgi:integrase